MKLTFVLSLIKVGSVCLLSCFLKISAANSIRLFKSKEQYTKDLILENRPWMRSTIDKGIYLSDNLARIENNSTDLYGSISELGFYYATVKIGGEMFRMLVDTGSSTLIVPLRGCVGCYENSSSIDPGRKKGLIKAVSCASKLCGQNTCSAKYSCLSCDIGRQACCSKENPDLCFFEIGYADRSGASGYLLKGKVNFADIVQDIVFGGIYKAKGNFNSQAFDGLIGLAYKNLACNPTCILPFLDSVVSTGTVKNDILSMCLGENDGTLTIGSTIESQFKGNLSYVPLLNFKSQTFYEIQIEFIKTGTDVLHRRDQKNGVAGPILTSAIIDSGTTLIVVSSSIFRSIKFYFQSNFCKVPLICATKSKTAQQKIMWDKFDKLSLGPDDLEESLFRPGTCYPESDLVGNLDSLPNISFVLKQNLELTLTPHEYIFKVFSNRKRYICLGIASNSGLDYEGPEIILGMIILKKYYFSIQRQYGEVGFARSTDCTAPTSPETLRRHNYYSFLPLVALLILSIIVISISFMPFISTRNESEPLLPDKGSLE